jgi:D-sedoheptulose 7-phosphate isomerase
MRPHRGDVEVFAENYRRDLMLALSGVDLAGVGRVVETLWDAYQHDRQIFFCGNGGSAASASHIVTDLTKGALGHRGDAPARPVRALSLTDNLSLISAWANDVSFDHVFLGQLRPLLRKDDVLVAMSVSGGSRNVVNAVQYAREIGAMTIAFTGARGGALANLAEQVIVVGSEHYGVVEDVHMQLGHVICYSFRERIAAILHG